MSRREAPLPYVPVDPMIAEDERTTRLVDILGLYDDPMRDMYVVVLSLHFGRNPHLRGVLPGSARALAAVCRWSGDAETFARALHDAGFVAPVDGGFALVDWQDGGGKVLAERERWRNNKKDGGEERRKPKKKRGLSRSQRTPEELPEKSTGQPEETPGVKGEGVKGEGLSPSESAPPLPPRGASARAEPTVWPVEDPPEPEPPWPRPGNSHLDTAAGELTPGEVEACLCSALGVTQLPGGWAAETLAGLGVPTCDAARLRRAVDQAQAELGKPPPTPRAAVQTLSTRLGYVRQRLLLPREQRRSSPRNVHTEPQDYAPPPAEIWGEGAA